MKNASKLILTALVFALAAGNLYSQEETVQKRQVATNDYADWKVYPLDAGIADESAAIVLPCKPLFNVDWSTQSAHFEANLKKVKYSVVIIPLDDFISELDLEDFDGDSYAITSDFKIAFLDTMMAEYHDDLLKELESWFGIEDQRTLEYTMTSYAGHPAVDYTETDPDEGEQEKGRIIMTDNAVYILTVKAKINVDLQPQFFFDSLQITFN